MERRTRAGVLLAVAALCLTGTVAFILGGRAEHHRTSFPVMGTVAGMTFYTAPEEFTRAVEAVKKEFDLVSRAANVHDEKSELSRLNAAAAEKPFACSPELWELLTESRRAYRLSGGAFDITVKPLMDLWGFYRKRSKVPSGEEIARARALTGLDKVVFDDARRTVKFTKSGMALDLGGIAKGYALERAARAVIALGITRGVVDLGGNLRLLPETPPGQECYRIGIRRPARKNGGVMPEILRLGGNCAVASSGDYERYIKLEGRFYGHIMDPATGIPAPGTRAVTAVAPEGTLSDWLSTAVYLRGRTLAEKLEKALPGTQFIIIEKEKEKE